MKYLLTSVFVLGAMLSSGQSQQGWVDVRSDLQSNSTITLDGEWELYWNRLIEEKGNEAPDQLVTMPNMWNFTVDSEGDNYPSFGYASYRKVVILDPTKEYAIHVPAVYNSFRLLINGDEVSKNGKVDSIASSAVPFWHPETTAILPTTLRDTNEFILQISNYHHFKGGAVDSIVLGDKEEILYAQYLLELYDTFLTGALIMGGLFFIGLYLFGRQQKSILYYSLFCLAVSYYIFGSGNYVLHGIFPNYPWQIAVRVEYLAIYFITILLVKFTESIYPEETPAALVKVTISVASLYIAFALFLPFSVFPKLHDLFLIGLMLVIGFGLYIYVKAALNKRIGSTYTLIGSVFLLSVFVVRVVHQLFAMQLPAFIVPIGYMFYFFLNALTLSQQFALAWKKAKDDAVNALNAKSNFLSTMSHEIRTPMNAVIGLTNHLIEDSPKDSQKEVLNTLKFSSQNLLVLLNDILDLSKIESNKVEFDTQPVDLSLLIDNLVKVFDPIAGQKSVRFSLDYDESIPNRVSCDPTRTTQVLTNLIGNAIKFTEKGSVTVRARVLKSNKTMCTVLFSIEDTGIGIPADKVGNIFESFTQASATTIRKYGGTGLGLSISKKILELQGVELKVNSIEGVGSNFYFEQEFEILPEESIPQEPELKSTDMKIAASILLVEDNDINILVAMKFLSKWGLSVDIAKNGQEALDQLVNQSYDLILMDLQMPVMDGFMASQQIRINDKKTPIIALTASALPEERERLFASGMNDYVLKPFEPSVLFETLQKYVETNQN